MLIGVCALVELFEGPQPLQAGVDSYGVSISWVETDGFAAGSCKRAKASGGASAQRQQKERARSGNVVETELIIGCVFL